MFFNYNDYEYYIRPGYTDMRCGIRKLMIVVQDTIKEDPFSKTMFLFCGKSRKDVKVLVWERNGFWLMQKKLTAGTFVWPKDALEARFLDCDTVKRLFNGEDVFRKLPEITGEVVI